MKIGRSIRPPSGFAQQIAQDRRQQSGDDGVSFQVRMDAVRGEAGLIGAGVCGIVKNRRRIDDGEAGAVQRELLAPQPIGDCTLVRVLKQSDA